MPDHSSLLSVLLVDPEKGSIEKSRMSENILVQQVRDYLGLTDKPVDQTNDARTFQAYDLGKNTIFLSEGCDVGGDYAIVDQWRHKPSGQRFTSRGVVVGFKNKTFLGLPHKNLDKLIADWELTPPDDLPDWYLNPELLSAT